MTDPELVAFIVGYVTGLSFILFLWLQPPSAYVDWYSQGEGI